MYWDAVLIAFGCGLVGLLLASPLILLVRNAENKLEAELEDIRNNVEKTYLVDSTVTSKVKTGSAITRAAIGEATFGTAGAIAGAASARTKDKHEFTFLVIKKDGSRYTDTVTNNVGSADEKKYKAYMEKLHVPGE